MDFISHTCRNGLLFKPQITVTDGIWFDVKAGAEEVQYI